MINREMIRVPHRGPETIAVTLFLVVSASAGLSSAPVHASDETSYLNYDAIVNDLKASSEEPTKPVDRATAEDAEWEDVALHGGLALSSSYVSLSPSAGVVGTSIGGSAGGGTSGGEGVRGSGLLVGVEFSFGMNLFTSKLRAEGAFSNYSQSTLDSGVKADLQEFDLRLVYMPVLEKDLSLRFGAGVAARYLGIDAKSGNQWTSFQDSAPSSLFLIGLEKKLSNVWTIGPDLSYRAALISDTLDKVAWNATIRLNATF